MVTETVLAERLIPSTRRLEPTPVITAATATSVTTVRLSPAAVCLVLALDLPANVASLSIKAAGSGAVLASYVAAPTVSYIILPVAPAIDSEVVITLTAAAGGPVMLNAAEAYEAMGQKFT